MRLLLVSHAFPPEGVGGVERYTEGLADALAKNGNTVAVAAWGRTEGDDTARLERKQLERLSLYRLRCPRIPVDAFLRHGPALERLFETVLAETQPEVVHFNHVIRLSPRLLEAASRHGARVVLSLHDYYFVCAKHQLVKASGAPCDGPDGGAECARTCFAHEGSRALPRWTARTSYFRLLLDTPQRVLCPSRFTASLFEPLAGDRLRLLPLGLPGLPQRPSPAGPAVPGRPLRLAVLGQVFANKGAHLVLEALARARLPEAHLALHGRIIERDYAQRLAERACSIPGLRFSLAGEYERGSLPARLADVDCVVVPSQWPETFSFVTREALALDVPVIVARIGALPEAISEGENGLTFAPRDPAALAGLLRRLSEDARLLRRLRAGARRTRVLPMHEHARAVAAVYEEALAERADGRARRTELARLERHLATAGFGGDGR